MKALSVQQPWAWLIINGHKDVLNQMWHTHYRGPLLIHANEAYCVDGEAWAKRLLLHPDYRNVELPPCHDLDRGKIIGSVELVDVTMRADSIWYVPGRWAWHVRNPEPMTPPIRWNGKTGLFEVDRSEIELPF